MRPGRLTNDPPTGRVHGAATRLDHGAIPRADVAVVARDRARHARHASGWRSTSSAGQVRIDEAVAKVGR